MINVLSIFHNGICTPLTGCVFASYKNNGTNITYFERYMFKKHFDKFKGVVDLSKGLSVIYYSEGDVSHNEIIDAVVEYVIKNKKNLVEQWFMVRKNG